ncbi:MAG: membrane dipeptidase [Clostridia bacterium]|nr:membrane dipeptidase [Clostridia bacterium]
MNYFDLHCDTLYEMYEKGTGFYGSGCAVSFENTALFGKYARIMAIWTKAGIPDEEAYVRYKNILAHAEKRKSENIVFCRGASDMKAAWGEKKIPVFLAVEGASILCGDISRLDELYSDGVRFLTLTWKNSDIIGGAWNTSDGLTDFGREVVKRCAALGIVVDVSHSSRATTAETLDIAEKCGAKVIATHSNAYSVCAHGRNLTDGEAKSIASRGGVIGISFTPGHLNISGSADISDIVAHAEHYLSLGLEDAICIGADFDGVVNLPRGVSDEKNIVDVEKAFEKAGFDERTREKIFFGNAYGYIVKNM